MHASKRHLKVAHEVLVQHLPRCIAVPNLLKVLCGVPARGVEDDVIACLRQMDSPSQPSKACTPVLLDLQWYAAAENNVVQDGGAAASPADWLLHSVMRVSMCPQQAHSCMH